MVYPVEDTEVDPRAPRFGQAITATLLALAVALREPLLIPATALLLVVPVVTLWRVDPYAWLWRALRRSGVVAAPAHTESASPHRFARLLGAVFLAASTVVLLLDGVILAYLVASPVLLLAALAATTGFCLGCRMYEHVALFRRLGVV